MRTVTEAAWAMPAVAQTQIYPLTARIEVNEELLRYQGHRPYRWLEKLDSLAVQQWVVQQNALSQPQLAALPQRWLKKRLTQLWNYERYEVPVSRGGHYFYLHNDGQQNQSVLYVPRI
jgi:prolyl oligopeptidase